jgi:hypothetical protein
MSESAKVNNLNELKGTYTGAKNNYIAALDKYNEALKQLNLNNKSPNANNDISGDEVTTKDKVKMKTTTAFGTDGLNPVDSDIFFQSTLTYSGATGGTIYSNQFVQRNLDELTSDVDLYDTGSKKIVRDATGLTADISDTTCDMTMFNRCDGYAKMTNRNYYGLSKNDDGCSCYVFDNTLSEADDQFVDVSDTGLADMNYFGIMFDGGLYYLTESNYSNNFNNLYDISELPGSTNTNLIPVTGSTNIQDTDRNPFTGSGPNTITIHSLGTVGCSEEQTLGTG